VAYRARLSRYTYQKYEKGESRPGTPANPSVRSLMAISQALGLELEDLLPDDRPDLTAR
jgi:transcriptional regulator with XRE-family HTH domain